MKNGLDKDIFKEILQKTLHSIMEGRKEIFEITENTRMEYESTKEELHAIQSKILLLIKEVDTLEITEKKSRQHLLIVSKNFDKYCENDIKEAYENAHNLKVSLILKRQEEKDLKNHRTTLELKLKKYEQLLKKAENLINKVGIAIEYLTGDLFNIIEAVDNINKHQSLGLKIIESQEKERRRVAREIHDGPAQAMSNLVLRAELCSKLISIDTQKAKNELEDFKKIVRLNLKEVRKIIYDLSPMSLDDLGLIPTLQKHISDFTEETDIIVNLHILKINNNFEPLIQLTIFRIFQEALNNIRKYSKATLVTIKIESDEDFFNMIIKDNGIGFDSNNKIEDNNTYEKGFGVIGMIERAKHLDGSLSIDSKIGEGTKLTLAIPMQKGGDTYE